MVEKKKMPIAWEIFLERFGKESPIGTGFMYEFMRRFQEIWNQVNPEIGKISEFGISANEKNEIRSTKFTNVFFSVLAETVIKIILKTFKDTMTKEEFEEYEKKLEEKSIKISEKTAKEIALKGMAFEAEINQIKCTECDHFNNQENNFCGNCGNELKK